MTQIIEQQLKGIDNMLYMSSTSDASGRSRTTLTFAPGTDIDVAQVQVQNKLQAAMNRLPDAVKSRGVFVTKGGQDFLVTYSFYSTDPSMTQVDIGDYLNSNLVDVLGRLDGVGDINVFGTFYAMRIWMDPALMQKYALMPSDLISALNAQNAQVSAGQLGALPAVSNQQLNATITARTKLQTVEEFENIVLKTSPERLGRHHQRCGVGRAGCRQPHRQGQAQRHARGGHGHCAGRWGQRDGSVRRRGRQTGGDEGVFPQRD